VPRPKCLRWIGQSPGSGYFKPRGIPVTRLEEIVMTLDELEALRLTDLDGLYQEEAAKRMHVSRPTFGRIVDSAHSKVADALVNGKALRIEGGRVDMSAERSFACSGCRHSWRIRHGVSHPAQCPACSSRDVHWHAPEKNDEQDKGVAP